MTTNCYDGDIEMTDDCPVRVAEVVAKAVEQLANKKQPNAALRLKWEWQSSTGQEKQELRARWWAESTASAIVMTQIQ